MKKLMTILGAFLFASVVLTSCGGGATADGEKMCKLKCEAEALQTMEETEENVEKALKLIKDVSALTVELAEKYKDDEEGQKDVAAAISACKCD
tara:strand:- start:325 stop:606 length:282 start_codon:yes stop_codon:yes gene_type:complete